VWRITDFPKNQQFATHMLGDAGINLSFVLAQVVGRKYAAVFGFENDSDAAKAIALIRKATAPARKR
jgi:hypothetical protein